MLRRISLPRYTNHSNTKRNNLSVKTILIFVTGIALIFIIGIYSFIPIQTEDENDFLWASSKNSAAEGEWNRHTNRLYNSKTLKNLHNEPTLYETNYYDAAQVCKIPRLDPFEPTIMKTVSSGVENDWKINCGNHTIFWTDHRWNLFRNMPSKGRLLSCCYRVMKPQPNPNPISYSNLFTYKHVDPTLLASYSSACVEITSIITKIPVDYEYISIECHKKKPSPKLVNSTISKTELREIANNTVKNETIVYREMFAFVPLKDKFKMLNNGKNKTDDDGPISFYQAKQMYLQESGTKPPSILIIGLDQVSHMQFIRHFPESYKFLKTKLGAKGLLGYNKVADTTLPNVVPLLTGLHLDELSNSCWNHSFLSFFDTCPFIWKNFANQGYLTSYAEDKMPFSTFYNSLYARRGFKNQPTDYFYNFFGMQANTRIQSRTYCTNSRLQYEDMLDYIEKTAMSLKNQSYFQFAWASSLFTKDYQLARNGDLPLVSTLKSLHENKLLKNTIIILLSDHGYRFSPLIELKQGRTESKLPLLYAAFPKSFTQKFPSAVQNFEVNAHRLTTAFDVFETLKDLLDPDINLQPSNIMMRTQNLEDLKTNWGTAGNIVTKNKLPRGISLFLQISPGRTCDEAGIEDNFCACSETKPLKFFDKSEIMSKFKTKIIDEINSIISNSSVCMTLKLNVGFRSKAEVVMTTDYVNNKNNRNTENQKYFILHENIPGHYDKVIQPRLGELSTSGGSFNQVLVTIQTIPGLGIFEGRLKLEGTKWIVQDVLRLNPYNNESHCVYLYKLKSFCFCKMQRFRYLN